MVVATRENELRVEVYDEDDDPLDEDPDFMGQARSRPTRLRPVFLAKAVK